MSSKWRRALKCLSSNMDSAIDRNDNFIFHNDFQKCRSCSDALACQQLLRAINVEEMKKK